MRSPATGFVGARLSLSGMSTTICVSCGGIYGLSGQDTAAAGYCPRNAGGDKDYDAGANLYVYLSGTGRGAPTVKAAN